MKVLEVIFIFVGTFFIGFCSGRIYNLRKMIADMDDLDDQFNQLKKLSNDLDNARVRYINELLTENKQLKSQLAMYQLESNDLNKIRLTKETSDENH